MRRLVVDRDVEAARALAALAKRGGYESKICLGVEEALEEIETFTPHAVSCKKRSANC